MVIFGSHMHKLSVSNDMEKINNDMKKINNDKRRRDMVVGKVVAHLCLISKN
jgi:hypothetical protein